MVEDKQMFARTMATLLCLDPGMEADLLNLSIDTLAKMYDQYLANAKKANDAIERAYAYKQDPTTSGNTSADQAIRHSMGSRDKKDVDH